jgi:molecular chaperone DnaK (HSP70)
MKLGIDFGTTRSVVAAVQAGRYPVACFELGDALRDHLPGLAALTDAGLVFGAEAAQGSARRLLRSLKRAASRVPPDALVEGFGVSALDLVTGYLRALRRALIDCSNLDLQAGEPLEAMVAVPASASGPQRYLTLEAFRRAGFEVLGMINEPTAAAIEYAHRDLRGLSARSPKRSLVVYDLGGGTFDASTISFANQRFELIASDGIAQLGGDDFDVEILVLALETLGIDPQALDLSEASQLLERCRQAKQGLGTNSRRLLVDLSDLIPGSQPAILQIGELFERCQPLVQRTLDCLDRLLGVLPYGGRELAAIYVAGGSALFPPVLRSLRQRYARKIKLAPLPHAATAIGLALAADPQAGVFVREATTRHLGVWREAADGREKVFDPLIAKSDLPQTDEPLVLQRRYEPAHRVGCLRFVECTRLGAHGEPAGDLTPLDEVLFPYDPSLVDHDLRDQPAERTGDLTGQEIVETYTCERDGRVSVVIENRTRGYRREYHLGRASRTQAPRTRRFEAEPSSRPRRARRRRGDQHAARGADASEPVGVGLHPSPFC